MAVKFNAGSFKETEESYRNASSKIARFGIVISAIIHGIFLSVFGAFFGGMPLFLALIPILLGKSNVEGAKWLFVLFLSIFVIVGTGIFVAGIRRLIKVILMIKNAPPLSAVPADAICREDDSPKPTFRESVNKTLGEIRDFRRGKIIVPGDASETAKTKISGKQRWLGAIFGLIFFAVGIGLCSFGIANYIKIERAAGTWIEVPCEIISAEVESHRSSGGRRSGSKTTYRPEITFRYARDGKMFTGDDVSLGPGFSHNDYASAKQELNRLKKRKCCWVNPANPEESALEKPQAGFSAKKVMTAVFGVPFALIGGIVAFLSIFGSRSRKHAKRELGEIAPEEKTVASSVFFALFWNSIIAVFIFAWFSQASSNRLFAVLLSPFVIIGIVLFVVAFNALRKKVFGVRYAIFLKPAGSLVAGTPVRVSWKLRHGAPEKLSRLCLSFLEMERDTGTQVNGEAVLRIVGQTVICESGARADLRSGACDFVPPEDHPTKRRFFAFELELASESALLGTQKLRFPVKLKNPS